MHDIINGCKIYCWLVALEYGMYRTLTRELVTSKIEIEFAEIAYNDFDLGMPSLLNRQIIQPTWCTKCLEILGYLLSTGIPFIYSNGNLRYLWNANYFPSKDHTGLFCRNMLQIHVTLFYSESSCNDLGFLKNLSFIMCKKTVYTGI